MVLALAGNVGVWPGVASDEVAGVPPEVSVRVDWSKQGIPVEPGAYGLNIFAGVDPEVAASPQYQREIAYLHPGMVRFHSWNMMKGAAGSPEGWLDFAHHTWDARRVRAVVDAFPPEAEGGPVLLINIPGWPEWMKKTPDGRLDPSEHEAFARFCAELVRGVNVDGKQPVRWWEITNERDDVYWNKARQTNAPDALDELAALYNRCAAAMKAVDPTIRTGGPAATRTDYVPELRRFVRATRDHLDFLSGHVYASGAATDPDDAVLSRPQAWGTLASRLATMLREEIPDRHVPLFIDEYNISWTWETRDVRMRNHKGAVFDALALAALNAHGTAATCAWNECDGTYGKTEKEKDGRFTRRPSAEVFHLFNTCLRPGNVVDCVSSEPGRVSAFAVASADGAKRSLSLVNAGSEAVRARITDSSDREPAGGPAASCHLVDEAGCREFVADSTDLSGRGLRLPPHSVCIVVFAQNGPEATPSLPNP